MKWKFFCFLLLFLCCGVLLFSLEPLFREPLYEESIPKVIDIQNNWSPSLEILFRIITVLGQPVALYTVIVFSYNFCQEFLTFFLLTISCMIQYSTQFLKLSYANPRPFFTSLEIKTFYCSGSFGNPSGHSICSTFFYSSLLFYSLLHTRKEPIFPPDEEGPLRERVYLILKRLTTVVFLPAIIVVIIMSRVYLGAHSINQVLFGGLVGLYLSIFTNFIIFKPLKAHYFKIIQPGTTLPSSFWLINVVLTLIQVVNVILYYRLKDKGINSHPEWDENIEFHCGRISPNKKYSNVVFVTNCVSVCYQLSYIGIVLSHKWFPSVHQHWLVSSSLKLKMKKNNITLKIKEWKMFLRMMLLAFSLMTLSLPNLLVKFDSKIGWEVCVRAFVAGILIGFIFFTFSKKACFHCGLTSLSLRNKVYVV